MDSSDYLWSIVLILWGLFWIIAPIAVYWDATQHKIGKVGKRAFLNMPAGAWGFATLVIGIIALPLYLFKRRALLTKAAEHPVFVSMNQRLMVCVIFLLLNGVLIWLQ